MPLQIRRGTNAERLTMTIPLASGELLYVTDDQRLYIGNGTTNGGVQITGYNDADAKDAAAAAFTAGTHSGISFSYNTTTNLMSATVDLSSYSGSINVDAVKGSVFADDSTLLVDGVDAKINLDGTVKGNIIPNADSLYDLGSASNKFKDLYLSGTSIHLGTAVITSTGSVVDLPAGSTINGVLIGTGSIGGEGVIPGSNYNINIVGDDSTTIVNSATRSINASGGVTGNIHTSSVIDLDGGLGVNLYTNTNNTISASFHNGTKTAPLSLVAGDSVGNISLRGYNGSQYAFAGAIMTSWEATANTASAYPSSTISIVAGNNTSSPVYASLNSVGTWSAHTLQTGVYTDTPDTRPTGVKGMIIFNDTTGKFQGYNGSAWVDLN